MTLSVLEKLEKANDMSRSVWDEIDDPIKPIIFQLGRLGIPTKYSCCGFHYPGEPEHKDHSPKAFIQILLDYSNMSNIFLRVFNEEAPNWRAKYMGSRFTYVLETILEKQPWGENTESSIHGYETQLIALNQIEAYLKKIERNFDIQKYVPIVDGNTINCKVSDSWLVKPHSSVVLDENMEIVDSEESREILDSYLKKWGLLEKSSKQPNDQSS